MMRWASWTREGARYARAMQTEGAAEALGQNEWMIDEVGFCWAFGLSYILCTSIG